MQRRRDRYSISGISRQPILPGRVREIEGGFAFIEHRFLHRGFFVALGQAELVLYLLLVIAADRRGVSFYGNDALCSLCRLSPDDYLAARNALIAKDLIAYDGRRFQVLSLPEHPIQERSRPLFDDDDFEDHDPATIRQILRRSLAPNESSSRKP
jgi:hypothetical protein